MKIGSRLNHANSMPKKSPVGDGGWVERDRRGQELVTSAIFGFIVLCNGLPSTYWTCVRVIGTRRGAGHPGPGQLSSTAIFNFCHVRKFTEHAQYMDD